jgi:hypothetical protein
MQAEKNRFKSGNLIKYEEHAVLNLRCVLLARRKTTAGA